MNPVLSFLKLKSDEQRQIMLMLSTGFFMGIFIATYTVTAESLFLNQLSEQLDRAFLFSGVFGILVTLVFTFMQNRIKFSTLTLFSIGSIVLFTFSVFYLYNFGDPRFHDEVLFTMYCLAGPMTAILLLCYWGIFGRLFNFRQSKRIIGWIDTGQLVASILAFFLIPLTAVYFTETSNYLIVCIVSILLAAIFFFIISFRFPLTKNDPREFDIAVRKETSFSRIFKDPYVLLLSIFLVISMVTFVFSQYLFQDLINDQYPDQRELTNFLAYFNGAIYLLSLVMQTFVNERIITNYGIRISLYVLPVVVGIFAAIALFTGIFFGYDIVLTPATFIFFFLFSSLTRLFNAMLRDSLENPVFKLLFIPLDSHLRFGIQAKVEGVVNETGRLVGGIFIFAFSLISFFSISWIPGIILLLVGAYFLVGGKLYNGYRNKIRSKLESSDFQQDKLEMGLAGIVQKLESLLPVNRSSKAIFSFKLLEKISPAQLPSWINGLMKNENDDAREYAQRRMNELKGLSVSDRYVIRVDLQNGRGADRNVISQSELAQMIDSGGNINRQRLQRLTRSAVVQDRQYAAELLLHSTASENATFLIELLHDNEPQVRSTAIKTAIQKNNDEVIMALIDNLGNSTYANQAMSALVLIGERSLGFLEGAFYRSGHSVQVLIQIIQVMARIGGQRAKDLLWNKIDYPDKVIVSQLLLALGVCGFKAGISQISRIKYAIESDIADISWNLNAIQELSNSGEVRIIRQALEREIQHDIEHIYMLLAMLYDTRSIQLVKENIESGTTEGTTYAVELLDVFLSESLKQRVIPVLDDLTVAERVKRLEPFYARMRLNENLVLKFLINRDFTQSNRWTKAVVLHHIGVLRIVDFKMDLIAQMFNADWLIKEVAAWSLYQISIPEYESNSVRLGVDIKNKLDEVILKHEKQTRQMVYDKVMFFKSVEVFQETPGITLSFLADLSHAVKMGPASTLVLDEKGNNDFFIIYTGCVEFFMKGKSVGEYRNGQFLGEMASSSGFVNTNLLIAKEETILLKINKDLFYELLANHVKLADRVLEYI